MSKLKVVFGTVIAAAAGVVAGILAAPKPGKETRADIKAKADDLREDAMRKADEAKGRGEEVVADAREKAEDLKARGERAVEGAKKGFYGKK